eukprot:3940409-Rhodomonas_salina.1
MLTFVEAMLTFPGAVGQARRVLALMARLQFVKSGSGQSMKRRAARSSIPIPVLTAEYRETTANGQGRWQVASTEKGVSTEKGCVVPGGVDLPEDPEPKLIVLGQPRYLLRACYAMPSTNWQCMVVLRQRDGVRCMRCGTDIAYACSGAMPAGTAGTTPLSPYGLPMWCAADNAEGVQGLVAQVPRP